ncbi:hypothetical protein K1728_04255 [Weissella confusa]|uniref:hypothetical protein n=1 Tax=Weissella confusa TaxID=1583 RepID=UPI001C6F7B1F|nr:hypothetical protein [Weissella confusa]QYU58619.1 hypothetical protein K1728_04255 [Weissella confusa]
MALNYALLTIFSLVFWKWMFYLKENKKQPDFMMKILFSLLQFMTVIVFVIGLAGVYQSFMKTNLIDGLLLILFSIIYGVIVYKWVLPKKKLLESEN